MNLNARPELIGKVVERLKALADESRIRLLLRLKAGPANVGTLSVDLQIGQASVSKHLSVLRQAGLVEVDRVGTSAIYRIQDRSVLEMCQIVCDGVVRHLKEQQSILVDSE